MAAIGKRVACGAAAVKIADVGSKVVVRNRDATNDIELGGPGVAVGSGFRVLHTDTVPTYVDCSGDALWAIAVAGAPVVDVLITND